MGVVWTAELPLWPEHRLSDQAVIDLMGLLAGAEVRFGQPLGDDQRPDRAREGERDLLGAVAGCENLPENRVRVVLDLDRMEPEVQTVVMEGLHAGSLGIGLDATCEAKRTGSTVVGGPDRDVLIKRVFAVRCLAVVPTKAGAV